MFKLNPLHRATVVALSSIVFALAPLSGCGGGGSAGPTKTVQYAKSYASGRIAGFGSIVINGVHYDETNAVVQDEDGVVHPSSDLKLGMMAEIQATDYGAVDNGGNGASNVTAATAQTIVFKSAMQGPVSMIDTNAGTLTVLGQPVNVNAATVFDAALAGGLSSIKVNDAVKIYGLLPAGGGAYTATRIEPLGNGDAFALRGPVSAYDATAQTATIGGAIIDLSVAALQSPLQVGAVVRFKLQAAPVRGMWVAMSERSGADQPQDADHSEVEGAITALASATSFSVDGAPVDASAVTLDASTVLALGSRVHVDGAVVNGVLVASAVRLETDQSIQAQGFDLDGSVTALDSSSASFVVRATTISFAGNVNVSGGTLADITVGSKVEVHGALATDGITVNATDIRIVLP
jgi:hypothetical protein